MKLNSKYHFTLLFVLGILINLFIGCKALHNKDNVNLNKKLITDTFTNLSGYLIFDGKKGIAYFAEINNINIEKLSKTKIKKLIDNSSNVILLRKGLNHYQNSEFISLTLCNKDQRLIVNNSKLLFDKFYIVKLDNFSFYKVNRKYDDSKQRLLFCEEE